MTDDIVTRLRRMDASIPSVDPDKYVSPTEAADEIERLRSSRDKWRKIANHLVHGAEHQLDEIRFMRMPLRNPKWIEALRSYDEAMGND